MNYPEHRPHRLRRSRHDRWIGGVCGGIAEYLNMDATLVRVAVVVVALITGTVPVVAIYLLMMLLIPEAGYDERGSLGPAPRFGWQQSQQNSDPVWGPAGPPWQPRRDPNIDTSAPQPPRQDPEELFRRAKHPTAPSNGPTTSTSNGPATPPSERPDPSGEDRPES